jgi:hypothetical protein
MIFWVAAGSSVDPARWLGVSDELMTRTGCRFRRVEPHRRGRDLRAHVVGVLGTIPGAVLVIDETGDL